MEINVYPIDDQDEHTAVDKDPSERFERYQKCLGIGAYKKVYLAFDTEECVEVAWNELKLGHLQKNDIVKVLGEVQILEQIRHENIINLYHSWISNNQVYFITELMTSGTLKNFIKKTSPKTGVKPKIIKSWCRQILKGLAYLHSCEPPIIHRDLKCENIFINGNNGQAKIGDLGLATVKDRKYASSVLGTPEFMAPELYEERYDEKVDIYSFGMCVLEMVTREYPYCECTNQAQIYRKVSKGIKPASLEKVGDQEVRQFIELCIQHDPELRPTAAELLDHPFLALPPPSGEQPQILPQQFMAASPHSSGVSLSATSSVTSDSQPPSTAQTTDKGKEPITPLMAPPDQQPPQQPSQIISVEAMKFQYPKLLIRMICVKEASQGADGTPQGPRKQEVKFPFNLEQDTPELVVEEMINQDVLSDADKSIGTLWISQVVAECMRENNLLTISSNTSAATSAQTDESASVSTMTTAVATTSQSGTASPRSPFDNVAAQSTIGGGGIQPQKTLLRTRSRSMNQQDMLRHRLRSVSNPQPLTALDQQQLQQQVGAYISHQQPQQVMTSSFSSPSSPVSGYAGGVRYGRTLQPPSQPLQKGRRARSISGLQYLSLQQPQPIRRQPAQSQPTPLSQPPTPHQQQPQKVFVSLSNASTQSLPPPPRSASSAAATFDQPQQQQQTPVVSPMSHYHRAVEEKTSELLEGVYRSQYRRSTQPQPLTGSGLHISTNESATVASDLKQQQPQLQEQPQQQQQMRLSVVEHIQALKERQRREADELARIHAVELLQLLRDHKQSRHRQLEREEALLQIQPSFYQLPVDEQLRFLERQLLQSSSGAPLPPLTPTQPPAPSNLMFQVQQPQQQTLSDPSLLLSGGGGGAVQQQPGGLSMDAERQLAALQQLAVSDFERSTLGRSSTVSLPATSSHMVQPPPAQMAFQTAPPPATIGFPRASTFHGQTFDYQQQQQPLNQQQPHHVILPVTSISVPVSPTLVSSSTASSAPGLLAQPPPQQQQQGQQQQYLIIQQPQQIIQQGQTPVQRVRAHSRSSSTSALPSDLYLSTAATSTPTAPLQQTPPPPSIDNLHQLPLNPQQQQQQHHHHVIYQHPQLLQSTQSLPSSPIIPATALLNPANSFNLESTSPSTSSSAFHHNMTPLPPPTASSPLSSTHHNVVVDQQPPLNQEQQQQQYSGGSTTPNDDHLT